MLNFLYLFMINPLLEEFVITPILITIMNATTKFLNP